MKGHKKSKLAAKIEKSNRKQKGKEKKKGSGGAGFDQASTPFHEGILPSQYNMAQSELERVGRKNRRTEW